MVVYLDGVIGLNFLVDWMLLLGVNRLSGFPPGVGRTAAAAAMGGGYAGACLIPGFGFLASGLWRAVSLGLMSLTAFGMNRSALRRGVLFVLLSMALGGLAVYVGAGQFFPIVFCAGALALLCRIGFRGPVGGRRYLPVTISHGQRSVEVLALADTGNGLRDGITGESVLVADVVTAEKLLGLTKEALLDPVSTMTGNPGSGFRLIPYQTVGQKGTFLLALRCDRVEIDGRITGGLVAFAPQRFGSGEYGALTGGEHWER